MCYLKKGGDKLKMTTMLRNLKIKEVSFVDAGANPDADITLKKNKEEGAKKEMTWLEKIGKAIAETLGLSEPEGIDKAATTFGENKAKSRVRRVFDNVWWDYQSSLRESIESIISDSTLSDDDRDELLKKTLEEFTNEMAKVLTSATAQIAIENAVLKAGRKISSERLDRMKASRDQLDEIIKEAEGPDPEDEPDDDKDTEDPENPEINTMEGDDDDMKLNKSLMTEAEVAIFEDLKKRYGTEEPETVVAPETVLKASEPLPIHPEVVAELASLKKFKEDAEFNAMTTVAKKYEIIGKKVEDLAPKLIAMQKSGAYDDFIAVLDEQVATVEKSGMFGEIGKRGSQGGDADPWTMIEKQATEIMKADPKLGYNQAIDKACQLNPELVEQYEKSRQ